MSLLKGCYVLQKCLEALVIINNTYRYTGAVFLSLEKGGVRHAGDKGWCTRLVHCKYTVNTLQRHDQSIYHIPTWALEV